ncbi:MAG: kinase [Magnetococcales bacterium]|nr:kinase [Magnetococcales bacterium]
MIITRTPFRISFFGGGTDYPAWYQEHGGAVLSTTIDKYCFITVRDLPSFFDYNFRIRYYKREETQTVDEILHPSVRECLRFVKWQTGVEMVHSADLPAQSGLGSSSTFTVGLLNALYSLQYKLPTKRELALSAIHVEQKMIGENVGSQDQTSAAFGGLNYIEFGSIQHISVQPLIMRPDKLAAFQNHLMLFFTGFSRVASDIAGEQIKLIPNKTDALHQMRSMVHEAVTILLSEGDDLGDFGRLLHQQWLIKRSMTHLISNPHIDQIYQTGLQAGAIGGKLLGAGGGGFMLFFAHPDQHDSIRSALHNLLHVPFRFEQLGSQVIYHGHHS